MSALRQQILTLVREKPDRLGRKELARALKIKGDDRRELRAMLRDMVDDGTLIYSKKKTYRETGDLPNVLIVRVTGIDDFGDMIGIPDRWEGDGNPPKLIVREGPISKKAKGHKSAQLGVGGRALCRLKPTEDGYIAQVLKKLGRGPTRHLGILYQDGRGWKIRPVDKKISCLLYTSDAADD